MIPKGGGFMATICVVSVIVFSLQLVFFYIVISMYAGNKEVTNTVDTLYRLTRNIHTPYSKMKESRELRVNQRLLTRVFGDLAPSNHPDLRNRSSEEVRKHLSRVFSELDTFSPQYKNPCWRDQREQLMCLPHTYILGQPKCGTTDIFIRISAHPQVVAPRRKEVRWFTRGEFHSERPVNIRLKEDTSLVSFTSSFSELSHKVESDPQLITIDGGPHTLWWPTQLPDGEIMTEDIPPVQILRELQPNARFIITLTDPVKRTYSDYNFLDDNLLPATRKTVKSPQEFHDRVKKQLDGMAKCIGNLHPTTKPMEWFRASQECAHDRSRFGIGGWGRICIGMYIVFIQKWLEHFPIKQFLFVRLEDYDKNPRDYMTRVFRFMDLPLPTESAWVGILKNEHMNEAIIDRETMLPETDKLLRDFYRPYNELLVRLLNNPSYIWESSVQPSRPLHRHPLDQHGAVFRDHIDEHHQKLPPDAFVDAQLAVNQDSRDEARMRIIVSQQMKDTPIDLKPKAFNITGLPWPYNEENPKFNMWINVAIKKEEPIDFREEGAVKLCVASFALDTAAVKFLLYDIGISPDLKMKTDSQRTALHCLSSIEAMADANSRSYIFALLKGKSSWLSQVLDPPLPLEEHSPMARDIINSMETSAVSVASWLLKAGADVNAADMVNLTPLHFAAYGGLLKVVELLLEHGADPNAKSLQSRTPLHNALAMAQVEVAAAIYRAGGDLDLKDDFGVSARDMLENPGGISKEDAAKYFNVVQRDLKTIGRIAHPELHPDDRMGWKAGTGGWGPERLNWIDDKEMHCDLDQVWAHEVTGDDLFGYLARSTPVLIRGMIDDWGLIEKNKYEKLMKDHGDLAISISEIPYGRKFGGNPDEERMTLHEYMEQVKHHRVVGGNRIHYLFKGHPIPRDSEKNDSLVLFELCPTPLQLVECVHRMPASSRTAHSPRGPNVQGHIDREGFVNSQWSLGAEGSGAPLHFHNTAWSALLYGAKKWFIYPPRHKIMSNEHILDFYNGKYRDLEMRGVSALSCIQTAGDVILIPESWGHGVLNIQESVAVATELQNSLWRVHPPPGIINRLPDDNRPDHSREKISKDLRVKRHFKTVPS